MVSVGVFLYDKAMKTNVMINSIKRLVSFGMSPSEACSVCFDFVSRFGWRDFSAYIRSVEVSLCG